MRSSLGMRVSVLDVVTAILALILVLDVELQVNLVGVDTQASSKDEQSLGAVTVDVQQGLIAIVYAALTVVSIFYSHKKKLDA